MNKPEILAPAGNRLSFLAALAAGADAVYCGLKHFSARMQADNFSIVQLQDLTALARSRNTRVYIALNCMIKPDEPDKVGRLLDRLKTRVRPQALIIADPGLIEIARQAGLDCRLHLSTLANFHAPSALPVLADLGIDRVVLPRELNIDEIRQMQSPSGPKLEVFVHGALCYGISGRCYWSSFLGGKSGLRGRCVQPCRRTYTCKGSQGAYFSCQDLGLDVLAKTLLDIPAVAAWKIEGRKKGPHYVYYTVTAYKMIRDYPDDPQARKNALKLLEMALGRPFSHYNFLPQRTFVPIDPFQEPASGSFQGKTQVKERKSFFRPRSSLLPGDLLRAGYENHPGHRLIKIRKPVPAGGQFNLQPGCRPRLPVFLVDRQEKELMDLIQELEQKLPETHAPASGSSFVFQQAPSLKPETRAIELQVFRYPSQRQKTSALQLSLDPRLQTRLGPYSTTWYFLPPVIWPAAENKWQKLLGFLQKKGAGNFVLGSPWQMALLKKNKNLNAWAGPFCNAANAAHLMVLREMGFSGAVLSPELSGQDMITLAEKACLPVGVVIKGLWPVCVSRTFSSQVKPAAVFESPKKEIFWTTQHDENYYTFPNWEINLSGYLPELKKAGVRLFLHMKEPLPKKVDLKDRPGLWNWDQGLV
ncbi:MAG: U32 family peptidase [Desulfonatronovibrionaceae bacterium]